MQLLKGGAGKLALFLDMFKRKKPSPATEIPPADSPEMLKVLVGGKIGNGRGGYYAAGDLIQAPDPEGLRAKGLIG